MSKIWIRALARENKNNNNHDDDNDNDNNNDNDNYDTFSIRQSFKFSSVNV